MNESDSDCITLSAAQITLFFHINPKFHKFIFGSTGNLNWMLPLIRRTKLEPSYQIFACVESCILLHTLQCARTSISNLHDRCIQDKSYKSCEALTDILKDINILPLGMTLSITSPTNTQSDGLRSENIQRLQESINQCVSFSDTQICLSAWASIFDVLHEKCYYLRNSLQKLSTTSWILSTTDKSENSESWQFSPHSILKILEQLKSNAETPNQETHQIVDEVVKLAHHHKIIIEDILRNGHKLVNRLADFQQNVFLSNDVTFRGVIEQLFEQPFELLQSEVRDMAKQGDNSKRSELAREIVVIKSLIGNFHSNVNESLSVLQQNQTKESVEMSNRVEIWVKEKKMEIEIVRETIQEQKSNNRLGKLIQTFDDFTEEQYEDESINNWENLSQSVSEQEDVLKLLENKISDQPRLDIVRNLRLLLPVRNILLTVLAGFPFHFFQSSSIMNSLFCSTGVAWCKPIEPAKLEAILKQIVLV